MSYAGNGRDDHLVRLDDVLLWVCNIAGASEELLGRLHHFRDSTQLVAYSHAGDDFPGRKGKYADYVEGGIGAYVPLGSLQLSLLYTLNNGEERQHWRVQALTPTQRGLQAELLYAATLSLEAMAHPLVRGEDVAAPALCILCHAQEGGKKFHYMKLAVGAKLSKQQQFISRKVAGKPSADKRHAKYQRVVFEPDM